MSKKEKERVQVGSVKAVFADPEVGKVVVRVPVFEDDDAAAVEAEVRAAANATRAVRDLKPEEETGEE